MIDRRTFVQQGAALVALAGGTLRLTTPGDLLIPVHSAIFDRRFTAARRFGRAIAAQGVTTLSITGDVTSVWFDTLHPLWKQKAVAIAGFTTYAPLFCLERLAWDHGMRVLRRDQHDQLYSWIIGPRRSA